MRKAIVVVGTLLALAGVARSDQAELGTDLMHSIEDSNKSLASNIAIKEGLIDP